MITIRDRMRVSSAWYDGGAESEDVRSAAKLIGTERRIEKMRRVGGDCGCSIYRKCLLLALALGLLVLLSDLFDLLLDNFLLVTGWLAISNKSVRLDEANKLAISLELLKDLPGDSERDLIPFGELSWCDQL